MLGPRILWRTLHIDGHLCLDCCERLVRTVRSLDLVHHALLDVDDGILYVACEPGRVSERRIDSAILAAGFVIGRVAPGERRAVPPTLAVVPAGDVRIH